jgi:hypothetical protein
MTKHRQRNTETAVRKGDAGQTDRDSQPATTEALRAAVQEAKARRLALEATGATHVAVRAAGFEIKIERTPGTVVAPSVAPCATGVEGPESNLRSVDSGIVVTSAPLVGIFQSGAYHLDFPEKYMRSDGMLVISSPPACHEGGA